VWATRPPTLKGRPPVEPTTSRQANRSGMRPRIRPRQFARFVSVTQWRGQPHSWTHRMCPMGSGDCGNQCHHPVAGIDLLQATTSGALCRGIHKSWICPHQTVPGSTVGQQLGSCRKYSDLAGSASALALLFQFRNCGCPALAIFAGAGAMAETMGG
jgi:hypothetical protein